MQVNVKQNLWLSAPQLPENMCGPHGNASVFMMITLWLLTSEFFMDAWAYLTFYSVKEIKITLFSEAAIL